MPRLAPVMKSVLPLSDMDKVPITKLLLVGVMMACGGAFVLAPPQAIITPTRSSFVIGTLSMSLKGKTLFITGASRGIGHAIGLRAARDGANVAIAAKTTDPHPKLPGTIHTAAEDMNKAGGKGLAVMCDIRDDQQIAAAVQKTVETFGGIDILVNNASAISLTGTLETPMKRYDLMNGVNARGTFACSQACLPHLLKSKQAHILNLSLIHISEPTRLLSIS